MLRNPGDWTTVEFFKEIGALDDGDRRFALFLEGLLSGSVNPNETRQRELVAAISPVLARAGLKIVESGTHSGYPGFTIVGAGTRPRPAQLILFASPHAKPALRIRDVLEQSIEVLTGDVTVLAYDLPVAERGLSWRDVESWWSHRRDISAEQARSELWRHLAKACADVSPAQRALLGAYYDYAKGHDPLFALLPEVWLHWDSGLASSPRGGRLPQPTNGLPKSVARAETSRARGRRAAALCDLRRQAEPPHLQRYNPRRSRPSPFRVRGLPLQQLRNWR